MKTNLIYAAMLCLGLTACTKETLVPEDELPSWLGESIYSELQNPKSLTGTFKTYLRLIDDLNYKDVLNKTGSKTIFPANDEAFEAFFKDGNNRFYASSYEELTKQQKEQLLYGSMIDNAILVGSLSNQQNSNKEVLQGQIVKHASNISLTQSVEPLFSQNMPQNNKYFTNWLNNGKAVKAIYDDTKAPIVHFSGEYMLNNDMTVTGGESDFFVLTGKAYSEGDAFVFDRKVINPNVTCQNGYIHQLDSVLVNPGNMAQCIRQDNSTKLFSRMLDYYSVPMPASSTLLNSYAEYSGVYDSVYVFRYFAKNSQRAIFSQDNAGKTIPDKQLLKFDPGWNMYNPTIKVGTNSESDEAEIAAIFVPTDDVVENYFLGAGKYILENLGANEPITKENLVTHLDAVYNNDPSIFAGMINNMMQSYLSKTVPSKFGTVQNDAFEAMGITLGNILKYNNGTYQTKIANNGVIYKVNTFFGPQQYESVLGPATIYTDMRIMGEMLSDHATTAGSPSKLGADMYYYLMSMKSKYATFMPIDNDNFYYIDPASVNDVDGIKALKFTYDPTTTGAFHILAQRYFYDESNGTFTKDESAAPVNIENGFHSQIQDLLNYHVVVLENGASGLDGNHYYKTKHGAAIYVPDGKADIIGQSTVQGGPQIGGETESAVVENVFNETSGSARITNGSVYKLSRPVQPVIYNVYKMMEKTSEFNDFLEFISEFGSAEELLTYCGIIDVNASTALQESAKQKYTFFGSGDLLRILSAYNYTIYVPTDMQKAYAKGLPTWNKLNSIMNDWQAEGFDSEDDAKAYIKSSLQKMREFVLYHVQNSSVFADVNVASGKYQTFSTDNLGIARTLNVSGGSNELYVTDAAGVTHKVSKKNILARDVDTEDASATTVNNNSLSYKAIKSSSFVVLQGIDEPLCYNSNGEY